MIGEANETSLLIEGIDCNSLIDTGSMISTLAEWFYKKHLHHLGIEDIGHLLEISVAGGYSLPYKGYIEAQVAIPGKDGLGRNQENVLILVVPDTEYNRRVPLLVGTNLIKIWSTNQQMSGSVIDDLPNSLNVAFQSLVTSCEQLQSDLEQRHPVVYTCQNVTLPGDSRVIIPGVINTTEFTKGTYVTAEYVEVVLPGGVLLAPCLVGCSDLVGVELQNLNSTPVTLPVDTPLCMLQKVETVYRDLSQHDSPSDIPEGFLEMFDLAEAHQHLSASELASLNELLLKWKSVFSLREYDLGRTSLVKHRVDLTDERPVKQRHHRIPPSMIEEVRQHLKEMLEAGVIRESHSPWASPLVLVRKKDKSLRICIDMRQVNLRTVRDSYYLPRIEESLDSLAASRYFSSLDLKSGYWQVELEESHKERTAFTAGPLGLYECNVMPYGLSNGCATFQRLMEKAMGELQPHQCLLYIDDILVFSATVSEHLQRLNRVFEKLEKANLKLRPSKCNFFKKSLLFLGHIVSQDGVHVDPDKVAALQQWPVPKNVKQLRQFLGFTGFYRRFIKNYSKVAKPLNDLLVEPTDTSKHKKSRVDQGKKASRKKNKYRCIGWRWSDEQQEAFDTLIKLLTSAPILAYADYQLPFVLHTDASIEGLGAILYQKQDGVLRVIAYASRGLKQSERNYPAHKLEFLALKWAITEKFNEYLYGNHFEVYTDNNPLTYVLTTAKLDAVGHRWLAELAAYDFSLHYRSGKTNIDADALSRLPGILRGNGDTCSLSIAEEGVQAVCQSQLQTIPLVETMCLGQQVVDESYAAQSLPTVDVRARQAKDTGIVKVLDLLRRCRTPSRYDFQNADRETRILFREISSLKEKDGIVYRERQCNEQATRQLVLPKNCRAEVFVALHDEMGYMGHDRTLDVVRSRFYWPYMSKDISHRIATCERCLRKKGRRSTRQSSLGVH